MFPPGWKRVVMWGSRLALSLRWGCTVNNMQILCGVVVLLTSGGVGIQLLRVELMLNSFRADSHLGSTTYEGYAVSRVRIPDNGPRGGGGCSY